MEYKYDIYSEIKRGDIDILYGRIYVGEVTYIFYVMKLLEYCDSSYIVICYDKDFLMIYPNKYFKINMWEYDIVDKYVGPYYDNTVIKVGMLNKKVEMCGLGDEIKIRVNRDIKGKIGVPCKRRVGGDMDIEKIWEYVRYKVDVKEEDGEGVYFKVVGDEFYVWIENKKVGIWMVGDKESVCFGCIKRDDEVCVKVDIGMMIFDMKDMGIYRWGYDNNIVIYVDGMGMDLGNYLGEFEESSVSYVDMIINNMGLYSMMKYYFGTAIISYVLWVFGLPTGLSVLMYTISTATKYDEDFYSQIIAISFGGNNMILKSILRYVSMPLLQRLLVMNIKMKELGGLSVGGLWGIFMIVVNMGQDVIEVELKEVEYMDMIRKKEMSNMFDIIYREIYSLS